MAASLFPQGVDMHSHILPGVDDGVSTEEEALAAVRVMKTLGLSGAYCTPHIMQAFPNTVESLRSKFSELQSAAAGEGFVLKLAAEYMIDGGFEPLLRQGDMLCWDGGYLLVELPQYMLPEGWMDSLFLIRELGYKPVLAHPERYLRILRMEELLYLAEQGVLFQGNVGSLSGFYGNHVRMIAQALLKRNLYHCWGTDAHSPGMAKKVLSKRLDI